MNHKNAVKIYYVVNATRPILAHSHEEAYAAIEDLKITFPLSFPKDVGCFLPVNTSADRVVFLYQYINPLVNARNANKFKHFCFAKESVVDRILSPPKPCYALNVNFEFVAVERYVSDIMQAVGQTVVVLKNMMNTEIYYHLQSR